LELFWCKSKRKFIPLEKGVNHCCEKKCPKLTTEERCKKPKITRGRKGDWIITPQEKKLFMEMKNGNGKNNKKNGERNDSPIVPFPLKVKSRNHLFFNV